MKEALTRQGRGSKPADSVSRSRTTATEIEVSAPYRLFHHPVSVVDDMKSLAVPISLGVHMYKAATPTHILRWIEVSGLPARRLWHPPVRQYICASF